MLRKNEFEVGDSGLQVWLTDKAAAKYEPMVKAEMLREYGRFVDPLTDELDTTDLTEWVAITFDLYANDWAIPETVFEWASQVEDVLIKAGKVAKP